EIVAEDVSSQSTTSGDFNVTDATLTIDPEEITEEEFLMDPADGGGVTHTVEGLQQGDKVDFNVGNTYNPMPELSGSAVANEDGVAEYVVYDSSDSAYVGGYSTVVMLRSEEHTSELQSRFDLVCRLLLEKKNKKREIHSSNGMGTTMVGISAKSHFSWTVWTLAISVDALLVTIFSWCCGFIQ